MFQKTFLVPYVGDKSFWNRKYLQISAAGYLWSFYDVFLQLEGHAWLNCLMGAHWWSWVCTVLNLMICCLPYWALRIGISGFVLWLLSDWLNTVLRIPSLYYSCAYLCYGGCEQNTSVWYSVMWAVCKSKKALLSGEILQNGGVNPRWSGITNVWMVCQTVHRQCPFHQFRFLFM